MLCFHSFWQKTQLACRNFWFSTFIRCYNFRPKYYINLNSKQNLFKNRHRTKPSLNFLVLTTELKLLIFKISARTFLKNFSFRKELKLFATNQNLILNNYLHPPRRKKEIQSLDFLPSVLLTRCFFLVMQKERQNFFFTCTHELA